MGKPESSKLNLIHFQSPHIDDNKRLTYFIVNDQLTTISWRYRY
jgi:Txe/YoeB family toxin of Txe-Axe toxin-antitoxin module